MKFKLHPVNTPTYISSMWRSLSDAVAQAVEKEIEEYPNWDENDVFDRIKAKFKTIAQTLGLERRVERLNSNCVVVYDSAMNIIASIKVEIILPKPLKVKDIIAQLSKLDQEREVCFNKTSDSEIKDIAIPCAITSRLEGRWIELKFLGEKNNPII